MASCRGWLRVTNILLLSVYSAQRKSNIHNGTYYYRIPYYEPPFFVRNVIEVKRKMAHFNLGQRPTGWEAV